MIYHISSLATLTYLALLQRHQRGPQPSHGVPFRAAAGARVAFRGGRRGWRSSILLRGPISGLLSPATMHATCLPCHRPRMLICAPCFQAREATFLVNKVHHTFRERGAELQTS